MILLLISGLFYANINTNSPSIDPNQSEITTEHYYTPDCLTFLTHYPHNKTQLMACHQHNDYENNDEDKNHDDYEK